MLQSTFSVRLGALMLRAIIFDFDGVIADSEPLHYAAFRHVLAQQRILLTKSQYYTDYIGMDDKGCFSAVLTRHHRGASSDVITELMRQKSTYFYDQIQQNLYLFDGVAEFVMRVVKQWPLVVVSGALREEIEFVLHEARLRNAFKAIISAEDVNEGKPNPAGFLKGLDALNRSNVGSTVEPGDCLVIEDSIPGIAGAQAARMRCLAVANTHPVEQLMHADAVTHSLERYDINALEQTLWGR